MLLLELIFSLLRVLPFSWHCIKKGLQQGLAAERQLLLRQARKRFGAQVAEQSMPLLERITDPQPLEDLGEQLLDSVDGDAWLQALRNAAR